MLQPLHYLEPERRGNVCRMNTRCYPSRTFCNALNIGE